LGRPSYIIQTSPDKYQFIYRFDNEIVEERLFEYVYEISKTLTKYFQDVIFNGDKEKIDNTFDMSRVGRLPSSINAKNGFKVKWWKTDLRYSLSHFEDFIKDNNITWRKRKETTIKTPKKVSKTPLKSKLIKVYEENDLVAGIDYKSYKFAYSMIIKNMFRNKSLEVDYSRADQAFFRRYKKDFEEELGNDIEIIITILRYCRKNLMEVHGHEIERYIELKIRDSY